MEDELRRVRWRCRRGMLELDIVLGRFIEQHYPALDPDGQAAFDALLDMPDAELWDMITGVEQRSGKMATPLPEKGAAVLRMIQAV